MKSKIACWRMGLMATCLALAGSAVAEDSNHNSLADFCNAVARSVYALAWPSATYRTWEFRDLQTKSDEIDLTIRLFGQSYFDGSDLWTDVTFDIEGGELRQVYWGTNNAILVPPGATVSAAKDAMVGLEEAYQRSQTSQ